MIMTDLFEVNTNHKTKYGEMVICLDNASDGYWRRDFYPLYKNSRKASRDESNVNYGEVYKYVSELTEQIRHNLPWKVIDVPKAEADDIMLVLAREYNKSEPVLIYSPDKDMIQAQRHGANVQQYSSLTNKWMEAETKHESMEEWVMKHCVFGDSSDGVPRITEDNESIKRFGPSTLKKEIKKHGSLDAWLDSHPTYRPNYERNFTLVMEEGIPEDIRNKIVCSYNDAVTNYNDLEFSDFCDKLNLKAIKMELPNHFKLGRELTAADFDW